MPIKLFSNLLVYRILKPQVIADLAAVEEQMDTKCARAPANQELSTIGFVEPAGEEGHYLEAAGNGHVFAVQIATRMLPGKIVRREVQHKVQQIEESQQRKVYAREKQQIKDEVIQALLPRAFVDWKTVYGAFIGPYLVIDSSSAKTGENIISLLRDAIGSMPVRPVGVKGTPIEKFTQWYTHQQTPRYFGLTGDFKANSTGDEFDFVNGKGTDPKDESLSDLVAESGRRVTLLGLRLEEGEFAGATFTVNEMLGIKGIKWPEDMMAKVIDYAGEDADIITQLRSTFWLLMREVQVLITALIDDLGGEEIPQDAEEEKHPLDGWSVVQPSADVDEDDLV